MSSSLASYGGYDMNRLVLLTWLYMNILKFDARQFSGGTSHLDVPYLNV